MLFFCNSAKRKVMILVQPRKKAVVASATMKPVLVFYDTRVGQYVSCFGSPVASGGDTVPTIPAVHTHKKIDITDFAHNHDFSELTGVPSGGGDAFGKLDINLGVENAYKTLRVNEVGNVVPTPTGDYICLSQTEPSHGKTVMWLPKII